MTSKFNSRLVLPHFPEEPNKARRAGLLYLILLASIGVAFVQFLTIFAGTDDGLPQPWIALGSMIIFLFLFRWAQTGELEFPSGVYLMLVLVLITTSIIQTGTIHTPATSYYILCIVLAGLLFNRQLMFIVTALSSLIVGFLLWAELAGLITAVHDTVQVTQWVTYTGIFTLTGVLMSYYLRTTQTALTLAAMEASERKNREMILEKAAAEWLSTFDSIADAILILDEGLRIVRCNKSAAVILQREEILGKSLTELFDNLEALPAEDWQSSGSGQFERRQLETRFNEHWFFLTLDPLTAAAQKFTGAVVVIKDITEQKLIDQALRQREESFRELADSITDVFFALDQQMRYTYWNAACESLTGMPAHQALGRSVHEIFPDTLGLQPAEKVYQQVLSDKLPATFINEYALKGETRSFEINVYPTASGISVFIRDISERVRTQETLRRSEQKFSTLFKKSSYALALLSMPNGKVQDVNEVFETALGFGRQDLLGHTLPMLGITRDFGTWNRLWTRLTIQGFAHGFEIPLTRRSGEERTFLLNVESVQIDGNDSLLLSAQDITEQILAANSLRESQQFLQNIVDNSDALIYALDLDGRFLLVNKVLEKLFGHAREEILGNTRESFLPPGVAKAHRENDLAALLAGKAIYMEENNEEGDGIHYYSTVKFPLFDAGGRAYAVAGISTDVTERRRSEEQKQEAAANERQRLAREMHDTVSQTVFSAGIIAETLPRLYAHHPELLESGLEDLLRLTRGAQAEMRTLLFELRPATMQNGRLNELLHQLALSLMSRSRVIVHEDIIGEGLVSAEVRLVLFRVVQEAFNNIAKYAHARHVTIRRRDLPSASAGEQEMNGPGLILTIQDDGRGFQPNSIPPGHHGIMIMQERMAAIGGSVILNSRPGEGTELILKWNGNFVEETESHDH